MLPDSKKVYLRLYTGMDAEFGEFLYLDLKIPKRIIPLWNSPTSLENCSTSDLMGYLMRALNEASLYTKSLGIRLRFESDSMEKLVEDFSREEKGEIIKLIKETKL